jgi:hypothetical protein
MPSENDLSDAIRESATAPRRTKVKGTEVEERDLGDLIKADQHLANKAASNRNHMGLRISIGIPPGCGG